ncbi:MAG: M14 metallopeptidase family protein [Alteraurantiacibacter sp.]
MPDLPELPMRRFLAALTVFLGLLNSPALAQSMVDGSFRPEVPTLEQVVGHRSGAQISSPEQAVQYLRALAEAEPERMRLIEYARSWEGRPLVYAVISSPANMARIEAVRADLAQLSQGTAPTSLGNLLPVTWLGYGVHGDEISSTDAALSLAYHLLAAQGDAGVERILDNTVVVIDPSQNPDGRGRFVNGYRAQAGLAVSGDRNAAAADQPWPGGRFNHYLFDLNRDWFAVTQPETRGRIAAIRQWQPVVVVDAHEMGGDESYFFPPVADPINPNVTQGQRDLMGLLGRNNAAAMDRIGQPYFTREVFDLFYPGYGDSWPTHNGAVGMTFEQASARGLAWERSDGSVLTYADGVRNHFTTTLATAQTVADNATRFVTEYAAFRRSAIAGQAGGAGYVIDLAQRLWNAEQLARRLALQGIAVTRVSGPATACGRSYPAGYLSVSTAQATGRLVKSLLDADTPLPPQFIAGQENRRSRGLAHELYDTTAWSVGQMSGLAVRECAAGTGGQPIGADDPLPARAAAPGAFGLAVRWTDSGQVRLVAEALAAGLVGRATDEAFSVGGQTFPRGTVVFARGDNSDRLDELTALATRIGAETVALNSGWVDSGPNLGSDAFRRLSRAPRVAMLWDDGVDPTSAGALRYTLEQRLAIPVTVIRTGTVAEANLGRYDALLVPDGNYSDALSAGAKGAIAAYARGGGVVVAIGNALTAFNRGDSALFTMQRETVLGGEPAKDEEEGEPKDAEGEAIASEADYLAAIADPARAPDVLPGALLNTAIDGDSFLSAGYDSATPVVFAAGDLVFAPVSHAAGTNVVRFAAADGLVASGYVWADNRRQMAFKPFMVAEPVGRGLAIGFTQDPATRGYLDGLDLLLANAVIMAPARVR